MDAFFDELDRKMDLCVDQLLERFEIQARKHVYNFPFEVKLRFPRWLHCWREGSYTLEMTRVRQPM
mgnify:CR=1 FL=1